MCVCLSGWVTRCLECIGCHTWTSLDILSVHDYPVRFIVVMTIQCFCGGPDATT